jgi:hypothetical protein
MGKGRALYIPIVMPQALRRFNNIWQHNPTNPKARREMKISGLEYYAKRNAKKAIYQPLADRNQTAKHSGGCEAVCCP